MKEEKDGGLQTDRFKSFAEERRGPVEAESKLK